MKTIELDGKTKDQIANVMFRCGTPKQQKESLEYCTIKTVSSCIKNNTLKDITIKDIQFLLSLAPEWTDTVEEGLDPTFYGTGSYKNDLIIKERIDRIKDFVKDNSTTIHNTPQ
jgi:hypothetical protein